MKLPAQLQESIMPIYSHKFGRRSKYVGVTCLTKSQLIILKSQRSTHLSGEYEILQHLLLIFLSRFILRGTHFLSDETIISARKSWFKKNTAIKKKKKHFPQSHSLMVNCARFPGMEIVKHVSKMNKLWS